MFKVPIWKINDILHKSWDSSNKIDSTTDFNFIAEDFSVEMLNLRDKFGKNHKTGDRWQNNSYLTGTAWWCTHVSDKCYKR